MSDILLSPIRLSELETLIQNSVRKVLSEIDTLKQSEPEADKILTIKQAGDYLNLTVSTLYGLVHEKKIPVCKRGKRLFFSKSDLNEWVKAGRKPTLSDIEAEANNLLKK